MGLFCHVVKATQNNLEYLCKQVTEGKKQLAI